MIREISNLPSSTTEYFKQLLLGNKQQQQSVQHQLSSHQSPLSYQALNIAEQAYQQIMCGLFQVKATPDSIQQMIPQPRSKSVCNNINNIDEIDKRIKQNEQILKQAKREIILHKKQQHEANRLEHEIKIQQNQQRLREWTQKQRYYQKRRFELAQKRQMEIQCMQQVQKDRIDKQKQQQAQQRKLALHTRLQTLSQSRQRRKQLYQQTLQQSKHIPQPKYKQIQNQFQKLKTDQQLSIQATKQNIRLAKHVNFDLIRQHQTQYLQRLEEKLKQKGYSSLKSISQQDRQLMESRFKSLRKRTEEQVQMQKQKFQRRLSYQNKIKEVEVTTDDDKRIKIQIQRDKAKNIFKYNFLKQKHFTDQQIFNQFKDFILDANAYQLGKKYLKEARKIGQQSRMKKSNSYSGVSTNSQLPSQRYTNYLPEIKARRSSNSDSDKKLLTPRDIEQAAKRMGNNQKVFENISKSLKKYDYSILNKKLQLQSLKMVSSTIKKEKEIDQLYMRSLKAKLACLEISYK